MYNSLIGIQCILYTILYTLSIIHSTRVSDGFYPDPDQIFEKKPEQTFEKKLDPSTFLIIKNNLYFFLSE